MGVIHLGGLEDMSDVDAALAVQRDAFAAARALAPRARLFVTVQDTGGDFGLAGAGLSAWLGGLAGLAKTAAIEWPEAAVKAIDCARAGRPAEAIALSILGELVAGGPEREVGLRADGARVVLAALEARAPGAGPTALTDGMVVVASGGARGVTAQALIRLAHEARLRLVLLGRTPLVPEPAACRGVVGEPELKRALLDAARQAGREVSPAALGQEAAAVLAVREIEATLAAIRQAGSEARYVAVDVADREALGSALQAVRAEWGPIEGVVHGAGVLADKLIAEKTDAQFERVFRTKVEGLRALLAATEADPLRLLCCFSSIAARTGNQGQCDYAMANEVLNKVAAEEARRRGDVCLVRALNWGPWDGGMVASALRSHMAAHGIPLIPLQAGAEMLVAELRDRTGPAEVVLAAEPASLYGRSLTLLAGAEATPSLQDHAIQGVPVVPAVLAAEWCMRAADAWRPGQRTVELQALEVKRGIQLTRFAEGERFVLAAREAGSGLAIELRGEGGALHYTARVGEMPSTPAPWAPLVLAPWPLSGFYDGERLFHGPAFQTLLSLEGIGEEGAAARLRGGVALGEGPWRTDVAALDGGLQLARLWAIERLGRLALPSRIGALRLHEPGLFPAEVRCELRSRVLDAHRTRSDLRFLAEDGRLLAEVLDLEITLLADRTVASSGALRGAQG